MLWSRYLRGMSTSDRFLTTIQGSMRLLILFYQLDWASRSAR
jgi:hypothetical protein